MLGRRPHVGGPFGWAEIDGMRSHSKSASRIRWRSDATWGARRIARGYVRSMAGEFDDIRGRLEGIAEELTDLAIIRLRDSIDAGGTELPVDEKRLTRARRAVEKAIHILDDRD